MSRQSLKKLSKFLSLILRHKPEKIGITLDRYGWANVEELTEKVHNLSFEKLTEIVEQDEKQRYSFNDDFTKIRANQGHSIDIDLGLTPQKPPEKLFHGTAKRFLNNIMKEGLLKKNRHHVHLSLDEITAGKVGKRHGKVVILSIDAAKMYDAGFEFFLSENKIWLTDHIPPAYLKIDDKTK